MLTVRLSPTATLNLRPLASSSPACLEALSHPAKSTIHFASWTGIQTGTTDLKQSPKFTSPNPEPLILTLTPPPLLKSTYRRQAAQLQYLPCNAHLKTAGSAVHLYNYIYPQIDTFPALKACSTVDSLCTISKYIDQDFSSPRCLEIISLGIGTARLRGQAPFAPLRLETLAPAITFELLLTWELSPPLRCQEGASDLLLK